MHPKSLTKGYRDVLLKVQAVTSPGETVCVCGSPPELGAWNVAKSIPLSQDHPDSEVWSGLVRIPADTTVEFRYLICIILESNATYNSDNYSFSSNTAFHLFESNSQSSSSSGSQSRQREVVVRRWETHQHCRTVPPLLSGNSPVVNGSSNEQGRGVDSFGLVEGQEHVDPGWLTQESVVQLKLYNNPITIWKQSRRERPMSIRISPIDLSRRISEVSISLDEGDPDNSSSAFDLKAASWPVVESSVMNDDECHFTQQEQFGRLYDPEDFTVYQAQMLFPDTIAYMVDLYTYDQPIVQDTKSISPSPNGKPLSKTNLVPRHMGFCYILPSNLRETTGTCTMPITGKRQQPIGQLTIEYLIVRPMPDSICDCRLSYSRIWKPVKKGLDVGHRGAGNRRRTDKVENVLENTIASFNYAARHGADMVELDVQLTKDKVPVIYHDYYICIAMKKKKTQIEEEQMQLAVKDLTAQQLQKLKLSPTDSEKHQYSFCEDDADDNQPFPTLQHVMEAVDPHVGFNVEIKCPMQYRDGTWEMDHNFDLNTYLDIILKTLLESAGDRYIILSCFHPDICTMVRLKQNRYPLLFLTQGQTDKYPPYLDTRTSTVPMAVFSALNSGLLGINVHTEELLRERSLIQFVKSRGLILFCWGDDINGSDIVKALKDDGVDGVIYDKVDEFSKSQDNVFTVESKSRFAVLEAAGHSAESFQSWSSSISNCSSP